MKEKIIDSNEHDRLCWQCQHSRLNTCPNTESRKSPEKGVLSCSEWITNPSVEYGDSPAKKRALRALLGQR